MTGHNGHQLQPLSQRRTSAQAFKRREKRMHRGTQRQQQDEKVAQAIGATNALNKGIGYVYQMHQRTRRMVYGLIVINAGLIGYVVGHVMGRW